MNQFESKIRDHLASKLDFIEKGLALIETEFHLKNSFGTNGRIDILAKDLFGNYVVIEIKRSDQAARQALHELFKYTSILHRQLGVAQSAIRAILVSTVWDELALPFSEFLEITPYHTEGIKITANSQGQVLSAEKFSPVTLSSALNFSSCQSIHFYENAEEREKNIKIVSNALVGVSVNDHVLFSVDYTGSDPHVIYPHGIYVTFSSPLYLANEERQAKIKQQLNWEEELDEPDENFLVAYCNIFSSHDTMEIGYPDKLRVMTDSWSVNVACRSGRFKSNERLMSDEKIVQLAMQSEGGSPHYLNCITSPKFKDRWNQLRNDSQLVAKGNSKFELAIPMILAEISARDPEAKVAVSMYNLANTHHALCKLCIGDLRYFPRVEIVSKELNAVVIYQSSMNWNKRLLKISPEDFFRITCEDPIYWLTAQHFGSQFEFDDLVRKYLGLETIFFQISFQNSGEIEMDKLVFDNKISRRHASTGPNPGPVELFTENEMFFLKYRELVSGFAPGLFEQ